MLAMMEGRGDTLIVRRVALGNLKICRNDELDRIATDQNHRGSSAPFSVVSSAKDLRAAQFPEPRSKKPRK